MPFGKAFRIVDQELFNFESERAQRELRKKIEQFVDNLIEDYAKTSQDFETLSLNLCMRLQDHVDDHARSVLNICKRTLDRQKQRETRKVLLAIYRKAIVPEIRNEKKWCEEMLYEAAKARAIPAGLFVDLFEDLRKDNSISNDLRKQINPGVPTKRRQIRSLEAKSVSSRSKIMSQQQSVLTTEQLDRLPSFTQKLAAYRLDVTDRTIRNLCRKEKLNRTENGPISNDDKFRAEYRRRHYPAQK